MTKSTQSELNPPSPALQAAIDAHRQSKDANRTYTEEELSMDGRVLKPAKTGESIYTYLLREYPNHFAMHRCVHGMTTTQIAWAQEVCEDCARQAPADALKFVQSLHMKNSEATVAEYRKLQANYHAVIQDLRQFKQHLEELRSRSLLARLRRLFAHIREWLNALATELRSWL